MNLKLGKRPASRDARDLRFARYIDRAALPVPPLTFGHQNLVARWKMLGNDAYGDCVFAGAAHETMLWTRESPSVSDADFTKVSVLADYSAVTGFDPLDPATDQGTDMHDAARYRRRTGIRDANGKRHKVGAYVALDPGNLVQARQAAYLFGACGIGFAFPASAMEQFNHGQTWDYVQGSPIEGGHYVPFVGMLGGNLIVVTWGQLQAMTPTFFAHYCDEAYAYLSTEMLHRNKSPEGFDLATLHADLAAL